VSIYLKCPYCRQKPGSGGCGKCMGIPLWEVITSQPIEHIQLTVGCVDADPWICKGGKLTAVRNHEWKLVGVLWENEGRQDWFEADKIASIRYQKPEVPSD
jgi:hypothetical protein